MNLPEVSEKLIEQLNHGSTKAFDKIYHTYYLYLCAIAVYYVHDKRVAGEIVNDVFVSFWPPYHLSCPSVSSSGYTECKYQLFAVFRF